MNSCQAFIKIFSLLLSLITLSILGWSLNAQENSKLSASKLNPKSHWAEGTPGTNDGATRDYYNRAALLSWKNFMGDWVDARGKFQGDRPFASTNIVDDDKVKSVEWNVTKLVLAWVDGKFPNQGMFLRSVNGSGTLVFSSREQTNKEHHPQLTIKRSNGKEKILFPVADTFLEKSTYRSQGNREELRVSKNSQHTLLRFKLDRENLNGLTSATLRLVSTKQYGSSTIGVFRCQQGHSSPPSKPIFGLAADYPGDKNIQSNPNVIFFSDFESKRWASDWTHAAKMDVLDQVGTDAQRNFKPLSGNALRVKIAKGSNQALNTLFKFKKEMGKEPEEIFVRYYLRLAEDWNQTLQGGKMPGISGTYGKSGWGGRKSNGTRGWSARGAFNKTIPAGNPLAGLHPIGTYCYHADMKGQYGDVWIWQKDYLGYLENNRWYSVEQYLKLNTPGKKDGILRAWIDGRLAFEKTDIRFRKVKNLKIEQIWMNVYHGGKLPSPYDQHLFIDNVVIAKKYIGPVQLSN